MPHETNSLTLAIKQANRSLSNLGSQRDQALSRFDVDAAEALEKQLKEAAEKAKEILRLKVELDLVIDTSSSMRSRMAAITEALLDYVLETVRQNIAGYKAQSGENASLIEPRADLEIRLVFHGDLGDPAYRWLWKGPVWERMAETEKAGQPVIPLPSPLSYPTSGGDGLYEAHLDAAMIALGLEIRGLAISNVAGSHEFTVAPSTHPARIMVFLTDFEKPNPKSGTNFEQVRRTLGESAVVLVFADGPWVDYHGAALHPLAQLLPHGEEITNLLPITHFGNEGTIPLLRQAIGQPVERAVAQASEATATELRQLLAGNLFQLPAPK